MRNKILLLAISCWLLVSGLVYCEEIAKQEPVISKDEKISLDLQGVDINELFKMLSLKTGLTIITTPEVQGRVTVFLNNLSFEDALDVIVTKQNLAYDKKGNLIKVMSPAEYEKGFGEKFGERTEKKTVKLNYAKPSNIVTIISSLKSSIGKIIVDEPSGTILLIDSPQAISQMMKTISDVDRPLETAVFDVNYAQSADIKTYLNELITPGVGQVIIDERSNKAIVSDLPQRLDKITKLMKEFDEESRQVLITGEIVQVSLTDKFSRGIDWEKVLSERRLAGLDFAGSFPTTLSVYQKISVGTLDRDKYKAALNFLQEFGDTKILSSPRIVVVNKEEAKILVGSREAYITSTLSQAQTTTVSAESIQFIDVGVKLKVVPTIGKDGYITMKIKPEVSSVRETITTSSGSQIPIVETSEVETVVKVKDGSMIMIAGLMKEEKRDTINGWPKLSKIPLLGALFGSRIKSNPKTELVVFLTPQLISGTTAKKSEAKSEK
jgi:type II secretory pathway component GspD/PulD (secretin)